jgi:hypothetical protein
MPAEQRNPRVSVQCMAGATDEYTKTQTIACSADHRLLVPLWRTDPLYHELRESHSSYEAQHGWWRDRYKVAADDLGVRPKILDIGWHRLRANVAALVDWLRISTAKAGSASPDATTSAPSASPETVPGSISAKLAQMRVRMGIMGAYGEKAEQLSLGSERRPHGRIAAHPLRNRLPN